MHNFLPSKNVNQHDFMRIEFSCNIQIPIFSLKKYWKIFMGRYAIITCLPLVMGDIGLPTTQFLIFPHMIYIKIILPIIVSKGCAS